MSSPQFALVPSGFPAVRPCSFNASWGTLGKVVLEPMLAAAETTTTPRYYGGGSLLDMVAASSDAATKDFALYTAQIVTTQGVGTTGTVNTTAGTIVRATGDFIADGWQVGDVVSILGAPGVAPVAGCEGLFGAVSAVAALTLTFTAIGTAWSVVGAIGNGARICKMALRYKFTVPANAGNTNAIANYSVLNNGNDRSLLRTELKLGTDQLLVLQPLAALSALPASISFQPQVARY